MLKRIFSLFTFIICSLLQLHSTNVKVGVPNIENYTRRNYKGGTQNWGAMQGSDNLMYFANNEGLLHYDGVRWKLIKQATQRVHRSVFNHNDRIYIGAFNEFGYYEHNHRGLLTYHSLSNELPFEKKDFDGIWRIHHVNGQLFFHSFRRLFIFENDSLLKTIDPDDLFLFSFQVNNRLYVQKSNGELFQWDKQSSQLILVSDFFKYQEIAFMLPWENNEVLVVSSYNGSYIMDDEHNIRVCTHPGLSSLKGDQLYCGTLLEDGKIAVGVVGKGLFVFDKNGQLIMHLDKEKGLYNNTVLSMSLDKEKNLWLGLDNGIAKVNIYSPLTFLSNQYDFGTGYAFEELGDNYYVGTNQGIYYISKKKFYDPQKKNSDFKKVENIDGQVWNLKVFNNVLYCFLHTGLYRLNAKNELIRISPTTTGAWDGAFLDNRHYLVGTYKGINVYHIKNTGELEYSHSLKGYTESAMHLVVDDNQQVWTQHHHKGINRLVISSDRERIVGVYDNKIISKLCGINYSSILKHKNQIYVYGPGGVYKYNNFSGSYNLENKWINFLKEGEFYTFLFPYKDDVWHLTNHHPGVIRKQEDGTYKRNELPFVELKNMNVAIGNELICSLSNENGVIFSIEDGFAHYSLDPLYSNSLSVDTKITTFKSLNSDSIYALGFQNINEQNYIPRFAYKHNNFRFEYAALHYTADEVSYSSYVEGFDSKWTPWSESTFREITNLHEGEYILWVKSKSYSGQESSPSGFKFIVKPPFIRSTPAILLYTLVILGLLGAILFMFNKIAKKRRERELIKQKKANELQIHILKEQALENEKEMIRLKNERLMEENKHKEKELTTSTFHLVKRNEFLNELKTDIQQLQTVIIGKEAATKVSKIVKKIDKDVQDKSMNGVFEMHLEQVHEGFLKNLKLKYPELTPRELRLCVYLRMNLSSKEIAILMNISPRGVEISRYRVRKKMELQRNDNLTESIMAI